MVQVRVRQTHSLHHVDVKSLIRLQDTIYLYNHSIGFRRHPYRAFREVGTFKEKPLVVYPCSPSYTGLDRLQHRWLFSYCFYQSCPLGRIGKSSFRGYHCSLPRMAWPPLPSMKSLCVSITGSPQFRLKTAHLRCPSGLGTSGRPVPVPSGEPALTPYCLAGMGHPHTTPAKPATQSSTSRTCLVDANQTGTR